MDAVPFFKPRPQSWKFVASEYVLLTYEPTSVLPDLYGLFWLLTARLQQWRARLVVEEVTVSSKLGGVYSADGQFVVQTAAPERRSKDRSSHSNAPGGGRGHGLFSQHQHHSHKKSPHHHHKALCECRHGRPCQLHWAHRRQETSSANGRRELIPRAKLRQRSPDLQEASNRRRVSNEKQALRASLSCCDRSVRVEHSPLRHTESTRQGPRRDRALPQDCFQGRYQIYGSSRGSYTHGDYYEYSVMSTPSEKQEAESDMEYDTTTSSETGSQETVKFNGHKGELKATEIKIVVSGPEDKEHAERSSEQTEKDTKPKKKVGKEEYYEDPGYETIKDDKDDRPAQAEKPKEKRIVEESTYEVISKAVEEVTIVGAKPKEEVTVSEHSMSKHEQVIVHAEDTICNQDDSGVERDSEIHIEELTPETIEEYSGITTIQVNQVPEHYEEVKSTQDKIQPHLEKFINPLSSQSKELMANAIFTKKRMEQNTVEYHSCNDKVCDKHAKDIENIKVMKREKSKEAKAAEMEKAKNEMPKRKPLPFIKDLHARGAKEQTYYEEEYSYEPELQRSSSKVVLRTRSLINLDQDVPSNLLTGSKRNKITTGPDGTFVIGGRKANSELNLSDESKPSSAEGSPKSNRYVPGEDLRKRKEEILKRASAPHSNEGKKFIEEINGSGGKSIKQKAIDSLKKYLMENNIALRELLINNNIVIIEPLREGKETEENEDDCRSTSSNKEGGTSNTLPRAHKPFHQTMQRHFFYHCFKTNNKPMNEEELPDPDKVKTARELFHTANKYVSAEDTILMLPIAAKMLYEPRENKPRTTPEVRVIDYGSVCKGKSKVTEESIRQDQKKKGKGKWTDTGSLSSGLGSDISCGENDTVEESSSKEHLSSEEEDLGHEIYCHEIDTHPVSPEVLKKIRACGTSVTYYGGRVIAHSTGPIRSPMTMTIMEEIRQTGHQEESRRSQYMGVKFRLVKSNSCGSRLELAGTDDGPHHHHRSKFLDEIYGPSKSIHEELAECKEEKQDEEKEVIKGLNVVQAQSLFEEKPKSENKPSWRSLIEWRKQSRNMGHYQPDMQFEEFEVIEGLRSRDRRRRMNGAKSQ